MLNCNGPGWTLSVFVSRDRTCRSGICFYVPVSLGLLSRCCHGLFFLLPLLSRELSSNADEGHGQGELAIIIVEAGNQIIAGSGHCGYKYTYRAHYTARNSSRPAMFSATSSAMASAAVLEERCLFVCHDCNRVLVPLGSARLLPPPQ